MSGIHKQAPYFIHHRFVKGSWPVAKAWFVVVRATHKHVAKHTRRDDALVDARARNVGWKPVYREDHFDRLDRLLVERVKLAQASIGRGEKIRDFAAALGIHYVGVYAYFKNNGRQDILEGFKNNRKHNALPLAEVQRRLDAVARHKTQKEAATALGITPATLCMWLARYCPDGVKAALEDFSCEEDTSMVEIGLAA